MIFASKNHISIKQKAALKKAKKKLLSPHRLSTLSVMTAQLMVKRGGAATGHFFNRASDFTIATNDGMELNLETLECTPREAASMFTITTNFRMLDLTVPANLARVNAFNAFVFTVMSDLPLKLEYLHRIYGYCMTCDHQDRRFYAHISSGSNGKTSVENCVENALGPFHKNVRESFTTKKLSQSATACTTDIMALTDARFYSANETGKNAEMDESRMKRFAEGGTSTHTHTHTRTHTPHRHTQKESTVGGSSMRLRRRSCSAAR